MAHSYHAPHWLSHDARDPAADKFGGSARNAYPQGPDFDTVRKAMGGTLSWVSTIDGVLAANDHMALGVLNA